ncbi:hypothetical protein [Rhizobium sp. PP-CC-3G-465]|uniref:hypothetical protein n=1 Tax=Rhizobium sp. PP-CC-3G-465 TaxID=2135648 RepID=UPI001042C200|nr:hypothetical protein C8J33_11610 [Rhizobium sp. PP-CC-3G-465]
MYFSFYPLAVFAGDSPYSYTANAQANTEFATLLAQGELIRKDFVGNAKPLDPHALISGVSVLMPAQYATPLLRVFFRGASSLPIFAKQGYFLVFYNPVSDVALVTFWKINGTTALFQNAHFMPAENLYLKKQPEQFPHWMATENYFANMRKSMTLMVNVASAPDGIVSELLGKLSELPFDKINSARALQRIAFAAAGLSDVKLPCGKALTPYTELASLRHAAGRSNIKEPVDPLSLSGLGGISNAGITIRFFVAGGQPDLIIAAAADEQDNCKIIAVTAINVAE